MSALPSHVFGACEAEGEDAAAIWLNRESVKQLGANDPEGWLTVFHEAAHVIFRDIDLDDDTPEIIRDATEQRAEDFAHFMLSLIGSALELASAHGKAGLRLAHTG